MTQPSAPLPAAVQAALASIETELRDAPRECFVDQVELLLWLRRQANRIGGVRGMMTAAGPRILPRPAMPRPVSRTVVIRKGRVVLVEVRRRQMEARL